MQARLANGGVQDYSALRVPGATWEDLDPLEFERFHRFVRESAGLGDRSLVTMADIEIAKALGLVEANHEVRAPASPRAFPVYALGEPLSPLRGGR